MSDEERKAFNLAANAMAKEQAEVMLVKGQIKPEQFDEKIKNLLPQMHQQLDNIKTNIGDYLLEVKGLIEKQIITIPLDRQERMKKECSSVFQLFEKSVESSENQEGDLALRKLLGLSDETMIDFYTMSLHLFEEEQYKDTVLLIGFMTLLDTNIYDAWVLLGLTLEKLEELDKAAEIYEYAILLDSSRADGYLRLILCYIKNTKHLEALAKYKELEEITIPSEWKETHEQIKSFLDQTKEVQND
ncbi:hypothetical protein N9Y92_03935 [Chlamydiales bacterium]|nr:hypothetical protein [Chlamydiales bacterium]